MPRIVGNIAARMEAARTASKAKSNNKVAVDPVAEVSKLLGANFEKIEVGKGIAYPIPEGMTPKSFLAKARGKLVSVSREGSPWAGRAYSTMIDATGEKPELLILRTEDTTPKAKKTGGRPKGSVNKPKDATGSSIPGIDAAKAHLSGNAAGSEGTPAPAQANPTEPTPIDASAPSKPSTGSKRGNGKANDTKVKDLTAN